MSVPILLMALIPIQPFAGLVIVQNIVRGFMRPFLMDYLNRHITTTMRATMLAVQSTAANLAAIVSLAIFGLSTDYLGLWSYQSYKKRIAHPGR